MILNVDGLTLDVPLNTYFSTGIDRIYFLSPEGLLSTINNNDVPRDRDVAGWWRFVLNERDPRQRPQVFTEEGPLGFLNPAMEPPPVRRRVEAPMQDFVQDLEVEEENRVVTKAKEKLKNFKPNVSPKIIVTEKSVISEINPANGKQRLGTTRYKEMERMYRELVEDHNRLIDNLAESQERAAKYYANQIIFEDQVAKLKANATDSAAVTKKMQVVIKDFGLNVSFRQARNMEDKLNLFFGALMATCRPTAEVEPDELAE